MSSSDTFPGKPPADYQEVLYWRIAERLGRIFVMNLLSIPLAFVFGIVFFFFISLFGKPPEFVSIDPIQSVVLLVGILLVFVLHEITHGVAMKAFGAKPRYGIIWKGLMFYATAPGHAFLRNQYILVSLAPLVSLSILASFGILIQAGTSNVWLWAVWAVVNGSGTIGDLWITAITLRYPEYAYIIDERDGIRVLLPKSKTE